MKQTIRDRGKIGYKYDVINATFTYYLLQEEELIPEEGRPRRHMVSIWTTQCMQSIDLKTAPNAC